VRWRGNRRIAGDAIGDLVEGITLVIGGSRSFELVYQFVPAKAQWGVGPFGALRTAQALLRARMKRAADVVECFQITVGAVDSLQKVDVLPP